MQSAKLHPIFGIVLFLISLGIIIFYAFNVYNFSPGGIGAIVGQVFGTAIIITLILSYVVKKYSTWLNVSLGLFFATLLMSFQNWSEMEMAIDGRYAQSVIAGIKNQDELSNAISKNPDNKVLKIFGILISNGSDTRKQIAQLTSDIEPKELQLNKPLNELSNSELVTFARALRVAQQNAANSAISAPAIYNRELSKDVSALNQGGENSVTRGAVSGVKSRHERELLFLVRSFGVSQSLYEALANQTEFLLSRQGNYSNTAAGLQFADPVAAQEYNELFSRTQNVTLQYQAVTKERTELEQFQSNGWSELQKKQFN